MKNTIILLTLAAVILIGSSFITQTNVNANDSLTVMVQGGHNEESLGLRWFISLDQSRFSISMTYAGNTADSGALFIGPMFTTGEILGVNIVVGIEPGIITCGDDSDNSWIGNVLTSKYSGIERSGEAHFGAMGYIGAMIYTESGVVMRFDIASYYEYYGGYSTLFNGNYITSWDMLFMIGYRI